MEWKTVLAYITGTVDQELLLRNEYLVAENRILRNQITGRVRLNDSERSTLAELGKRLGKKALAEVVSVVKPETLLAWHRKLIARKFDGAPYRRYPGRPHQQLGSGLAIIYAANMAEGRFVTRAHWGSPAAALIRLAVRYASKIPQILSSRRKNQPSREKARPSVGTCQDPEAR